MKLKDLRTRSAGFTLLEILVVVVIIGIMASVVVMNVAPQPDKARVKKAETDIASIESAIEFYLMDNSDYPESLAMLEPEYIKRLPNDPWGNPYQIVRPGAHSDVDILSFGSDGVAGGDELAADIGNWQLR